MPIVIAVFFILAFFSYAIDSKDATLFLVEDPGEAVCLDGSSPGYYFRPGKIN